MLTQISNSSFSARMAAKKQRVSASKVEGEVAPADVQPKKRTRKKKKRIQKPASNPLQPAENFDPQLLADLAIKIIHLKSVQDQGAKQESRLENTDFHEALDDARRLLLAAKGVVDEDIAAYRIFPPESGLMSFDQIANHFKANGWNLLGSRNKVEAVVFELVREAQKEVLNEKTRYEELVSVRHQYAGGVFGAADRVIEKIKAMISNTEFEILFPDPDKVAEMMGNFFLHIAGQKIAEDWESQLDEEFFAQAGVDSFIRCVCGGKTFEQFIPDPANVAMTPERLACLEYFLAKSDEWSPSGFRAKAKELSILMVLTKNQDTVPKSLVSNLTKCVDELRKPTADPKTIKQLAKEAHADLQLFSQRRFLQKLVPIQRWDILTPVLVEYVNHPDPLKRSSNGDANDILELVERATDLAADAEFEVTELRSTLERIWQTLETLTASLPPAEYASLNKEMDQAARILKRGLQAENASSNDPEMALEKLLHDLTPLSTSRKCRPYDLFVFASQKRLLSSSLVRRRSSLDPSLIPGPRFPLASSILISHQGAD